MSKSKDEVARVLADLNSLGLEPRSLWASPVPQAIETCEHLAASLGLQTQVDELLRPLHLGVLSGLSRSEAEDLHPEAAGLMEKWRMGEIEIAELDIPGAEDYGCFYQRGRDFLDAIANNKGTSIVVGTRSILILLASILLQRTPELGGGYREIRIANTSFLTFVRASSSGWHFDRSRSSCPEAALE